MKNKISICILVALLSIALPICSYGQIPYVYDVEHTGVSYPAPPFPAVNDCPVIEPLPDPFAWAADPLGLNPARSTDFNDWSHHRAEFKAQIEHYEIGTKPAVDPSQVQASYNASNRTLSVTVTVGTESVTLTSQITFPSGTGPFPVVIGMNGNSLPASAFSSRNIARMQFNANQVTTYGGPAITDAFFRLYPTQNLDNTGQYAAWSWGVSRLIDGLFMLQDQIPIDVSRIAVTGCSYAGKMALFAGAFDERIALTIPQESGGGGATSWRYSYTMTGVEGLSQTSHEWFAEQMFTFGSNVSRLPVDHHMLCAMVAPRALFFTGNAPYVWLAGESSYVLGKSVRQIYETLGISDRFGFAITSGHDHCAFPASLNASLGYFLDRFLLGDNTLNQEVEIFPNDYEIVDYERWYNWWGTGEAVLPPPKVIPDGNGLWLEAECGVVGPDWTVVTDALASGGTYIVGNADNHASPNYGAAKSAVFTFTVEESGAYQIIARLNCPTADDDSYHIKVNDGSFNVANNLATNGTFKWVTLLVGANLTAGENTLTIVIRENGAQFDKLFISKESFASVGMGGTSSNCGLSGISDVYSTTNAYYNSGLDALILSGYTGKVGIYDVSGRLILETVVNLDGQIDLSSVAKGVYFVGVPGSSGNLKFIK